LEKSLKKGGGIMKVFDDDIALQGILVLTWKKKKALGDALISLFIDSELINIIHFNQDSQTILPLAQGPHLLLARIGFHKVETKVDIKAAQYTEIDLEYSRTAGNVKYSNIRDSGPVERNTMMQIVSQSTGRRRFMKEISAYTYQGFQVLSLTDTQAVIFLNRITRGMPGLAPAVINAATDRVVIDLNADGTVSSSLTRKLGSGSNVRSLFCSKCGKPVSDGQAYCINCGNKL
jgi:hypothetical protein